MAESLDQNKDSDGEGESVISDDVEVLKLELKKTQDKLGDALSQVAVAQVLQENLCSMEHQNASLQEELATMQILLTEATSDGQPMEHLRAKYSEIKAENRDLRTQINLLSNNIPDPSVGTEKKSSSSESESFLGVTKTLAKRVKSSVQTVIPASPSAGGHEDTGDMARAREGAEMLREIVQPMEEQIVALKGKLRETDSLLQEYEKRQATSLLEMEAVAAWMVGNDKTMAEQKLKDEVGDGYSGGEGELFHAMLAARIGMLVQELEAVKDDRDRIRRDLDGEKKKNSESKENVERMQNLVAIYREQVATVKSQMTDHQKEQLGSVLGDETVQKTDIVKERVITHEEWAKVLAKLDNKLTDSDSQTESSADEHNKEDKMLKEIIKERDHLRDNCSKYQEDLKSETAFRKEMEETWNRRGEEFKAQVEMMEEKLRNAQLAVSKINSSFLALTEASRRDLQTFTKDREKIVRELKRLQQENDVLVGKHSILSEQMAGEVINLPDTMEDMQLLLLTYREDLIAAKLGKERAEERLRSDVGLLRGQLVTEQQNKISLEKQLRTEITELQTRIKSVESLKAELVREREKRRVLETNVTDKEGLTLEVANLRKKVSSLQLDLDNSVAVQNDFVRLSQSLQVELEKIRQAEKEVRWQHEEDVEDCNSCRQGFSVMRKQKLHCRHCGRIFCGDCVSKEVISGPSQKTSRVCEVCHTLLSHHSAPYFSMEAPAPVE